MKETKFNQHKWYLFGRLLSMQAKMIKVQDLSKSKPLKNLHK